MGIGLVELLLSFGAVILAVIFWAPGFDVFNMADAIKDTITNVTEKVQQLATGEGSTAQSQPNLIEDPVTKEMVSKTELKQVQPPSSIRPDGSD